MSAFKPTERSPNRDDTTIRDSISKLTVSYVSIKDSFRKGEPRPEWSYRAGRRSTARVFYRQQKRPAVFGENGVERRRREGKELAQWLAKQLTPAKSASDVLIVPPQNALNQDTKPKRIRKPRVKKDAT